MSIGTILKELYENTIYVSSDKLLEIINDLNNNFSALAQSRLMGAFMRNIQFQSTNHKRFENGIQLTHDFVPRIIQLQYSDNGLRLTIRILPTLSPKSATFQRDSNNTLYYIGDDTDYRFEVETKANNEINRVSVIRTDRNLELKYF
jgi:hypothetical protein